MSHRSSLTWQSTKPTRNANPTPSCLPVIRKYANSRALTELLTYKSIKRRSDLRNYEWIVYDIEVKYLANKVLLVCYEILDCNLRSIATGYFRNFACFVLMVFERCQSNSTVLCAHNGNRYDHMFFLDCFTKSINSSLLS